MKSTKVVDKKSGLTFNATYERNRLGNLRYFVNGKFCSDKQFDRKYNIVNEAKL